MSHSVRRCLDLIEESIAHASSDEQLANLMEIKSILSQLSQDAILVQEYNRIIRIPIENFCFAKVENSLLLIVTTEETHYVSSTLDTFIKLNPGVVKIKRGIATLPGNIYNLYALNSRWYASIKGAKDDVPVSRNEIKIIREKLA